MWLVAGALAAAQWMMQAIRIIHKVGDESKAYFGTTERKLIFVLRMGMPFIIISVTYWGKLSTVGMLSDTVRRTFSNAQVTSPSHACLHGSCRLSHHTLGAVYGVCGH